MHRTDGQVGSAETRAAKLRGILELAVIAIVTIDDRGLIETVNPATERLFRLWRRGTRRTECQRSDARPVSG